MPLEGHPLLLPISLQLLEVLKAAWKHHPGPGGGLCLGLEASAAVLSEALSKSLPLPLGEKVFIFLNCQQMETEASPGKMCLFHSLPRSRLGLWLGGDMTSKWVSSEKPVPWKNPVSAKSPEISLSLSSSYACS